MAWTKRHSFGIRIPMFGCGTKRVETEVSVYFLTVGLTEGRPPGSVYDPTFIVAVLDMVPKPEGTYYNEVVDGSGKRGGSPRFPSGARKLHHRRQQMAGPVGCPPLFNRPLPPPLLTSRCLSNEEELVEDKEEREDTTLSGSRSNQQWGCAGARESTHSPLPQSLVSTTWS
uniref:Uncharacterized protein n=1 Tax=Knipowitschia caucasica TaxID=637954 RepID=A0AAV2LUK0_KNICA